MVTPTLLFNCDETWQEKFVLFENKKFFDIVLVLYLQLAQIVITMFINETKNKMKFDLQGPGFLSRAENRTK